MFAPVDGFSDDSGSLGSQPPAKPKKRKRTVGESLTPENRSRLVVGKSCKYKLNCMRFFAKPANLARLTEFKEQWNALHKLDQDQVEPSAKSNSFCLCCFVQARKFALYARFLFITRPPTGL